MPPLGKGTSRAQIQANIRDMLKSGHSEKQSVAAAMREARESGPGLAFGQKNAKPAPKKKG